MSLYNELCTASEILLNEMRDLSSAAAMLRLKAMEVNAAYDAAVRLHRLVFNKRVFDADDIYRLRDVTNLVGCYAELFARTNGLNVEDHRAYHFRTLGVLGEMEREALK